MPKSVKQSRNRAERTLGLLKRRWASSLDIIQHTGTVTPSKCLHEVRQMVGASLISRRVEGTNRYEYRVRM